MKKLRPIIGISLLVQSATFFILFLVNIERKKNLAKAFAAFSAISGTAGILVLVKEAKDRKRQRLAEEEMYDEFDEFLDSYDDTDVDEDDILCTFEGTEA